MTAIDLYNRLDKFNLTDKRVPLIVEIYQQLRRIHTSKGLNDEYFL